MPVSGRSSQVQRSHALQARLPECEPPRPVDPAAIRADLAGMHRFVPASARSHREAHRRSGRPSARSVGVVLALAMLVAPASAASLLFQQVTRIMLASGLLGFLAVVIGLYTSFHADVSAGPTIVLSSVALFVVAFLGSPRGLRSRRRLA